MPEPAPVPVPNYSPPDLPKGKQPFDPPPQPEVWFAARGPAVRELQVQLQRAGFYEDAWGEIKGAFGPRTDEALRAFQEAAGINPDGIADEITWLNLYAWDPGEH